MAAHRAPLPGKVTRRRKRWLDATYVFTAVVLGLVAVLVAVGPVFGLHTVRLATGSMSPGLPANSLLLVQDTPAARIQAGDVVMVQRPDHRPVTHRVVLVEPSPDITAGAVALTLRGDANAVNDPEPYLVNSVGRMLFGLPVGGQVVTAVSAPAGMVVVTLLLGVLTLWVLWPSPRTEPSTEVLSPEGLPTP